MGHVRIIHRHGIFIFSNIIILLYGFLFSTSGFAKTEAAKVIETTAPYDINGSSPKTKTVMDQDLIATNKGKVRIAHRSGATIILGKKSAVRVSKFLSLEKGSMSVKTDKQSLSIKTLSAMIQLLPNSEVYFFEPSRFYVSHGGVDLVHALTDEHVKVPEKIIVTIKTSGLVKQVGPVNLGNTSE